MVNEQEAINVLSKYAEIPKSETVREAYRMAISALEKQIPKKVEEWLPFFKAKCPSCNGHIEAHASNLYCCRCGQALDWSDTE